MQKLSERERERERVDWLSYTNQLIRKKSRNKSNTISKSIEEEEGGWVRGWECTESYLVCRPISEIELEDECDEEVDAEVK